MSARAAAPSLAELAARVPEDDGDEASVVEALRVGLADLEARLQGHHSGDFTPLHIRLRRSAEAPDTDR